MRKEAKPFVKWAGGKTQILSEIRKHYPLRIEKYLEPFVGGGAVLFDVLQKAKPKKVLINDINQNLVNTYEQVKSNVGRLCEKLNQLQNQYLSKSDDEKKLFFYEKRYEFNSLSSDGSQHEKLEKTALFIFLNKTCFNGLYRVNKKGEFNVPFNNAKNPLICDEENLRACSELLQNVEITCGDYKTCATFCDEKTFVYLDPPYRPLTKTAAFTSYSENGFGDKEQIELEKFVAEISEKGAKVLLSNSDPKNVDEKDEFFDELYKDFDIERVFTNRAINSKGNGRGIISEILINNFIKKEKILIKYQFTAEELLQLPEYKEIFFSEIGDWNTDSFAKNRLKNDIAKSSNYSEGIFYHATGGTGEIGLGKGLYLGKDKKAVYNFYNGEGEFGSDIEIYEGEPNFLDLTVPKVFENFESEAINKYGKSPDKKYFEQATLALGFDGIRYFDPCATGEEFILYKTDKVKLISKKKKKREIVYF